MISFYSSKTSSASPLGRSSPISLASIPIGSKFRCWTIAADWSKLRGDMVDGKAVTLSILSLVYLWAYLLSSTEASIWSEWKNWEIVACWDERPLLPPSGCRFCSDLGINYDADFDVFVIRSWSSAVKSPEVCGSLAFIDWVRTVTYLIEGILWYTASNIWFAVSVSFTSSAYFLAFPFEVPCISPSLLPLRAFLISTVLWVKYLFFAALKSWTFRFDIYSASESLSFSVPRSSMRFSSSSTDLGIDALSTPLIDLKLAKSDSSPNMSHPEYFCFWFDGISSKLHSFWSNRLYAIPELLICYSSLLF